VSPWLDAALGAWNRTNRPADQRACPRRRRAVGPRTRRRGSDGHHARPDSPGRRSACRRGGTRQGEARRRRHSRRRGSHRLQPARLDRRTTGSDQRSPPRRGTRRGWREPRPSRLRPRRRQRPLLRPRHPQAAPSPRSIPTTPTGVPSRSAASAIYRSPPSNGPKLARRLLTDQTAQVRPVIGQTFPLTQAAQAHTAIENRNTIAKALLTVD